MYTSNFAKYNHMTAEQRGCCVSIARVSPWWYKGIWCRELAPPIHLLKWWRESGKTVDDQRKYKDIYKRQVLAGADPQTIAKIYGEYAILLCWEAKGKFCHRRIVAGWIEQKLGIEVPEL